MRRLAIMIPVIAVLASAGPLTAHEGHAHKVMGTVAAIRAVSHPTANTHLDVKTKEGQTVTIELREGTKYVKGAKGTEPASLSDIVTGARVVVSVTDEGGTKTANEVRLSAAPAGKGPKPEQKHRH